MNIVTLDRELLLEKLQKINAFVPKKTVTPIFEDLKMSVGGNIMEIMASDGGVQAKVFVAAKTKDTFVFTVPAKLFIATVTLLRENELTLKVKGKKLELKSGKGKYSITILEDEYPTMEMKSATSEISLHQFYLKQGLSSTQSFVDEKNPLPQLIGINIAQVDKKIVFTGAISAMVCRYEVKPISINRWENIVLPIETANKTCSMMTDKGEVLVTHCKDKVMFSANTDSIDRWEIMSTLTDVVYPATEGLFSKLPEDKVIINTGEFNDCLKRLKLYTLDIPQVFVRTNENNVNEFILSAANDTFGTNGEEVITVNNVSGKHFNKSFNADQFTQVLRNVEENEFAIHLNESDKKPNQILPVYTKEGLESNFRFLLVGLYNN